MTRASSLTRGVAAREVRARKDGRGGGQTRSSEPAVVKTAAEGARPRASCIAVVPAGPPQDRVSPTRPLGSTRGQSESSESESSESESSESESSESESSESESSESEFLGSEYEFNNSAPTRSRARIRVVWARRLTTSRDGPRLSATHGGDDAPTATRRRHATASAPLRGWDAAGGPPCRILLSIVT